MLQLERIPFTVELTRLRHAVVVKLRGPADMSDADLLREHLAALHAEEVPTIVLDLSEMDFIGSDGLSVIIVRRIGNLPTWLAPVRQAGRQLEIDNRKSAIANRQRSYDPTAWRQR